MEPYEDSIGHKPLRKPGYVSPREIQAARDKRLSQQLIAALEEARARSDLRDAAATSTKIRAKQAYEKLQYDYPVCPPSYHHILITSVPTDVCRGDPIVS